jgi:hypothetical protein
MKKLIPGIILMFIMLGTIHSQTIKTSVFSAGGGATENDGYTNFGTFGQPLSVGTVGSGYKNREGFIFAQQNCLSVAVSSDITICYNENPGTFTSTFTSAEGEVSYQWQEWMDNAWHNIAGAVTDTYAPGNLIQTTAFRLLTDDPSGCGQAGSTTITITVHEQLVAGSTVTGTQTICYGETPAALQAEAPTGGSRNFAYQWEQFIGAEWVSVTGGTGSSTLSYQPPALTSTTAYRLAQTDTYCDQTQTVGTTSVTITVEPLPVTGTLAKTPPGELVLTGVPVWAELTAGEGGNGTDLLQYRTFVGDVSSNWQTYTSATPISTHGDITRIEIRTQRQADVCEVSDMEIVFWVVDNTPVTNVTQNLYYHTIQGAVDDAAAGDEINMASGNYNENVNTTGIGGLTLQPGFSQGVVTITGTFTLSAGDVLEMELFGDDDYDKFIIQDVTSITGASLVIKVMGSYQPAAGTRFIIFTSPNNPGKFTSPTLIKANGHYFILSYEEEGDSWNVVLTAAAQLFKMEINSAGR